MTEYALFFESGGPVFGNGYIVSVRVHGRLLFIRDEKNGEFQLRGVNPGSLLGFGSTLNEAYQGLVESLRCILIDIASEATSVDDFRREAADFFDTTAPHTKARWETARSRARDGELPNDLNLRVERSNPKLGIEVQLVEKPSVNANAPAQHAAPTAIAA